jgi:hypothetical protein
MTLTPDQIAQQRQPRPDQSPEALRLDLLGGASTQSQVPKMQLFQALRRQHPDYLRSHKRWHLLRAVAAGGEQADNIKLLLLNNVDNRSRQVQEKRASVAPLVNKIGPIIARFVTQLFVDTPNIEGVTRPWLKEFEESGARLSEDPDQRATFVTFLDRAMFNALTEGMAFAQVDTRTASGSPFLAGQQETGELTPYVVLWDRDALWDWTPGENGFEMVKLHRFNIYRKDWLDEPKPEHLFTIFERDGDRVLGTQYRVRRIKTRATEQIEPKEFIHQEWNDKEIQIEIVTSKNGTPLDRVEVFNRNGEYQFPLIALSLPGFLCVGDQLLDLQKEHYNNRVGLNWAIQRANFAMPVVKGPDDPFKNNKVGDGYYLFVKEDTPGETEITSFAVNSPAIPSAAERETVIGKDIYETLQTMAYLADQTPAAMQRSEESRLTDKELEHVLLARHGDILRDFAVQIIRAAAIAANDPVDLSQIKVNGFSKFRTNGLMSYLPMFVGLSQIGGVPVPSFTRRKFQDMIRLYGTTVDANSEDIQRILDDIDEMSDEDLMTAAQPPAPAPAPGVPGASPENQP